MPTKANIKNKNTAMTEVEFKNIKKMQELGIKAGAVANLVQRSSSTIYAIYRNDTLDDYINEMRVKIAEREARRKNGQANQQDTKAEPATEDEPTNEPLTQAPIKTYFSEDSLNLQRIATALERLADAWERQPETTKKKGLFS